MKLTSLLIALVAVFGAFAGLLVPKSADALNYSVHFELWPGGGSSLECGWHAGPCYNTDSQVASGYRFGLADQWKHLLPPQQIVN